MDNKRERSDLKDLPSTKEGKSGKPARKPGGNRGRKPQRNGRPEEGRMPARNESSWYTANAKLVEASARIPFPYRPGLTIPTFFKDGDDKRVSENFQLTTRVPGIFTIDWFPAIGISKDVTSPISLAARDIFSKVRSAFSGSLQADAPDFIIHMMAMDSVYAYIAHLKRIYRMLITFDADNQITPEVILQSMGWSTNKINQLMVDKVSLFGIINELISMTNRFYTPNIMPVFTRHIWMSERVYTDAPMVNSQLYLFNLTHVYRFTTETNGAGMLEAVEVPKDATVAELFTFGRSLIEALSNWDDAYIINGYLMKAYEGTKTVSIAELDSNEKLELTYNEVVLSQIENAMCAPARITAVTSTIKQINQTNALNATYTGTVEMSDVGQSVLWSTNRINCRQENPTAVDTIEATRLMTKWQTGSGVDRTCTVVSCGTEIVTNFKIMQHSTGNVWTPTYLNSMMLHGVGFDGPVTIQPIDWKPFITALIAMSAFDWHPIMLCGVQLGDKANAATIVQNSFGMLGDIHNITFISDKDMDYINRCCLYSEFGSFGA